MTTPRETFLKEIYALSKRYAVNHGDPTLAYALACISLIGAILARGEFDALKHLCQYIEREFNMKFN